MRTHAATEPATTITARAWWVGVIAWVAFLAAMPGVCGAQFIAYTEPSVMTDREYAGFRRIFQLAEVPGAAADSLYAGAKQELMRQIEESRAAGARWSEIPRERRTPEQSAAMMKDLKEHEPDIKGLRAKLLKDLQAVLDEPQRQRWTQFEYFLRRERWLSDHNHWNCSDATNLIGMVDRLHLDAEGKRTLTEILDRYEREMDSVLTELERAKKELDEENGRIHQQEQRTGEQDAEARRAAWLSFARSHRRLVVLNDDFVAKIAGSLPEEQAKELRATYERVALSEAYGVRGSLEGVMAAASLPGLDEETREKVRAIVSAFRPIWDERSAKIAAMERRFRGAAPGESVDAEEWDAIRIERSNRLSITQTKLKELLDKRQFAQMLHEGSRREREWKDSMSR